MEKCQNLYIIAKNTNKWKILSVELFELLNNLSNTRCYACSLQNILKLTNPMKVIKCTLNSNDLSILTEATMI